MHDESLMAFVIVGCIFASFGSRFGGIAMVIAALLGVLR